MSDMAGPVLGKGRLMQELLPNFGLDREELNPITTEIKGTN
jgi:hypothetical protein